jgi:rhodanese-related sulfurtransferase
MKSVAGFSAIIFFAAFALSQPAPAAENEPDSFGDYVAQLRKTIDTTDMDGYLVVVKNPDGALLIDVREADEFEAGHVPGTTNVPRGLLELRIWRLLGHPAQVDTGRRIYVQCATGRRALLAAKQLKDVGFTNVTAVVMDLADWVRQGHPFVTNGVK